MSGKGSTPRPFAVEDDVYSANWGAIDWNARENSTANVEEADDGRGREDVVDDCRSVA